MLTSGIAQAQSPAIGALWIETSLAQEECLNRAERAMQQLRWLRVEQVRAADTVYGDSPDNKYQVLVRCVSDKRIVFFSGAGPDMGEIGRLLNGLKAAFQ